MSLFQHTEQGRRKFMISAQSSHPPTGRTHHDVHSSSSLKFRPTHILSCSLLIQQTNFILWTEFFVLPDSTFICLRFSLSADSSVCLPLSGRLPPSISFHHACSPALAFNGCSEHLRRLCWPMGSSNLNSYSNTKKNNKSADKRLLNKYSPFAVCFIEVIHHAVSKFNLVALGSYCTL